MQILYVTDLVIDPAAGTDPEAAAEVAVEVLSAWAGDQDAPIRPVEIFADGHRDLHVTHGAFKKYAEWSHLRTPAGAWVTRLDVVTVESDGSHFTARVSVGQLDGTLRLRLGLAREVDSTGLSPVAEPVVRQPRVLVDLVSHPSLRVSSDGQVLDGKFLQARGPKRRRSSPRSCEPSSACRCCWCTRAPRRRPSRFGELRPVSSVWFG